MTRDMIVATLSSIPGVTLYTDTWRGHRTIDTHLTTDKDGHFSWKGAPTDAVMMDNLAKFFLGFMSLRMWSGSPDAEHRLNPWIGFTLERYVYIGGAMRFLSAAVMTHFDGQQTGLHDRGIDQCDCGQRIPGEEHLPLDQ